MNNWSRTKLVSAVVLGVSLASLALALVAGLTDSLSILIDSGNVSYFSTKKYFGGVELGMVCLGMIFLITLILAAIERSKGCYVVSKVFVVLLVAYLVASAIALRVTLATGSSGGKVYTEDYAAFLAYISSALTITVTAVLAVIASLFLNRTKAKPAEKTAEPTAEKTSN